MEEKIMTVTEQLDALIAEYNGSARDALNHTLAQLEAAQGEIETLKAQLHRAELAAEGWTPASEPPDDSRDVILRFPDLSEAKGWYSLVIGSWVLTQRGVVLDVYLDTPDAIPPVAWKELEA